MTMDLREREAAREPARPRRADACGTAVPLRHGSLARDRNRFGILIARLGPQALRLVGLTLLQVTVMEAAGESAAVAALLDQLRAIVEGASADA